MKKVILYFGLIFFFIGCNKNDVSETKNYPECIETIINKTLEQSVGNPRAKVDKFNYMNMIVFVYQHGHADPISVVYNNKCEVICDFGGISQVNSCENWDNAEFIETIWTDPR
jgi:uncharacterized protein with von Willebrand factor type A (vWA) domain